LAGFGGSEFVAQIQGISGCFYHLRTKPAGGCPSTGSTTAAELELALKLAERYLNSGADLPDLVVMAMASQRRARVLTWDFRHFRAVVLRRGHHWPLLVEETELPAP
jgi:hypothetical protein